MQVPDHDAVVSDVMAALESGYTLIGVSLLSSDLPFVGAQHLAAPFWTAHYMWCKAQERKEPIRV